MVMVLQIVATGSSNGLQLVIGQRLPELSAGSCQRIVETVVGIAHLIDFEYGLQTTFVKAGIMSDEGQGSYLVSYIIKFLIREVHLDNTFFQLLPYFGKHWRILSVAFRDAMYPLTPIILVVWLRLDQTVERVSNLPVAYHDYSYGADTRRLLIGRLEVDGYEVSKHYSILP